MRVLFNGRNHKILGLADILNKEVKLAINTRSDLFTNIFGAYLKRSIPSPFVVEHRPHVLEEGQLTGVYKSLI